MENCSLCEMACFGWWFYVFYCGEDSLWTWKKLNLKVLESLFWYELLVIIITYILYSLLIFGNFTNYFKFFYDTYL